MEEPQSRISVSCAEGRSPDLEDLCEAMFIEGARVLGYAYDAPIPLESQDKILQAASMLAEKLAVLVAIKGEIDNETEIGN
ncbi:MAG TPA: hypothetical protein VMA09_14655 [Candidatus Binataceae bacterium]|nr:hypothetical protein [Candidatus Binataceae bacterium]